MSIISEAFEADLDKARVEIADLKHRLSLATADPESQASQLLSKHNALLLASKNLDALSEELEEAESRVRNLEAELRKYEPSDGEMHQQLAFTEALREAVDLVAAERPTTRAWQAKAEASLELPVVRSARRK